MFALSGSYRTRSKPVDQQIISVARFRLTCEMSSAVKTRNALLVTNSARLIAAVMAVFEAVMDNVTPGVESFLAFADFTRFCCYNGVPRR